MRHDFWTERLSEWIDGELDARAASAVEEHVAGCPDCQILTGGLKEIRSRAGALTPEPPDHDLWPTIRAEMHGNPSRATVIELSAPGAAGRAAPDRWRPDRVGPARFGRVSVAALPLVAVLALLAGWVAGAGGGRADPGLTVGDGAADRRVVGGTVDPSVARVRGELIPPDRAELFRELEHRILRETASLPPETLEQLRRNLATIDRAIAEALNALARDPSNGYLRTHAGAGVDRKERLLRGLAEMLETDR